MDDLPRDTHDAARETEEVEGRGGGRERIVAIVPAKDAVASIAATVESLLGSAAVGTVLVVDDGSVDGTGVAAQEAGAEVVVLPRNRGKAAAVAAGVAATPAAEVYLLVDADTGSTAAAATRLLGPVLDGAADLVIGNLPSAGGKGGFGLVNGTARRGIRMACGYEAQRPLSGQRAVRGDLLRSIRLAPRYGMEVSMTVDFVRGGARVLELPVEMEHRHTGRSLSGFLHRGRQGIDVVLPLLPRLLRRSSTK